MRKRWAGSYTRRCAGRALVLAVLASPLLGGVTAAQAQPQAQPKITIGISGWTGFAPLTLAEKEGIFRKNGVDVSVKFIPQAQRLATLASGDVQAVATTIDAQILWGTTVPLTQVLLLDQSNGGDGVVVKNDIATVKDLRGKKIAVDAIGTSPYFLLAYALKKSGSGLSPKDMSVVTLEPQPAAQAFLAGQTDGASTYEPYLSQVRDGKSGRILISTTAYPCIIDTLAFQPDFIAKNTPAVQAVVKSWFDALDEIKADPGMTAQIMGAAVKQSGPEFLESAKYIKWADRQINRSFMEKDMAEFMKTATEIELEAGILKKPPVLDGLVDSQFVK